ncbi:MAG: hypothetical protein JRE23_08135 [Deltaproteobacteria bacterium]|nr:hypothetical protein [Deltaproteobacteria bacterium]
MTPNPPQETWLDTMTRVDELLLSISEQTSLQMDTQEESKNILEEIKTINQEKRDIEEKSLQITYPSDGGTKTVTSGITTFNFVNGTVTLPTGLQEKMSESLHDNDETHCRSMLIKANKSITIQIDNEGSFSPDAQAYFQIPYKKFRTLKITTTAVSTKLSVQAYTNPAASAYMSSVASLYSVGENREWLEIDGDTYFTDALIQDASENESFTIERDEITLMNISLYSLQQLKYRLWFYSRDTFAINDIIGYIDIDLPTAGATKIIGGTTYYYYNISDVDIPYRDADETSELHLQLENKSTTSKNAGATGKTQISLSYGVNS